MTTRVVLVGGGLANSLIAHRLATTRPEIDLLILERESTLGGNHIWSFHEGDLSGGQREWMAPFVTRSWPGYEVRFPGLRRRLESPYHAVTSARLQELLAEELGDRVLSGVEVVGIEPREVRLGDGRSVPCDAVIDGRGFPGTGTLLLAYQKFLGCRLRLETGHGLETPILMDATVEQRDGFRFIYTLPFTDRSLLVEDTRYSDGPDLDREEMRREILEYAGARGWRVKEVEGEEEGILPIVLGGDLEAFWREGPPGVPRSGLRAALFHPTTGYSLPEAVRLADELATRPGLESEELHRWIGERSRRLWKRDAYLRFLNRMLFGAAEPRQRYRVMQRFYRLPAALIERFYAGRLTIGDRARILCGKPPVPVLRALRCIRPPRWSPQPPRGGCGIQGRKTMGRRRAAVIGSGFGGLALAVRLQAAGVQTVLLEGLDRPGGRAYVYRDGRYAFDGGPTVITAPEALEAIFRAAGREMADFVELLPVRPFYRLLWEDGYAFDYSNDLEALNEQIARKSPRDVDGYARFLRYVEDVFQEGYVKLASVPFLDFASMIRVSPQLMRLQAFRSVYGAVSRFIRDPHLRQVFSFHSLLVGGNPFTTSSIYTLIHALERKWGVFFPKGGTGALVSSLVRLFEELGGELRLGCPVERIVTVNGKVTGIEAADGWSAKVDAVASNADVVHTYGKLLARETLAQPVAARLRRRRFSMSLFVIYFGVRRRHPSLAHHSVLFGPRYRELLKDIFARGILAEDFSLYLHAPTVTDPEIAPEGCEAFYVLSPVPHLGKAPLDWKSEGPRYRDRILEYLEKRYIPGLGGDLETVRIFGPEDFRDRLNAHHGSAFSLEPILSQSAWFRVHNRDPRIGGLYFVGAGTHPGAGVPGVVNSAEATAGLMLADLGVSAGASA